MSDDMIIRAEGLGKKYQVAHQQNRAPYFALRDVIAQKVKTFMQNPRRAIRGSESHEEFWALKGVSLQVQQGEVVGVIGRNGAGKSTLLKVLSRITEPTEGCVRIKGRVASLLEVGTGFHPELTGREKIFLNGAILGMKHVEIKRKFDEIVAFAEVEQFLDLPVKRYSSGMYMRLAFAVAAHMEPEILIVDEVLAVGDAAFQQKCLGRMSSVSRQGRTVLFVSHNMAALRSLCTRAVWLNQGQLKETGETSEVINHYLQMNTANNLESKWEDRLAAPGDDRVRLRSVRVIPQGDLSDQITVHTPLRIEFTYWNYVPGEVLNVAIFLYNLEEVCVFNIASDAAPRPVGLIRHTVEIPGDFLNTGSYYLNMLIVKDASRAILQKKYVVAFEVVEGEIMGKWYGRIPGAVRPRLTWRSETLERSVTTAGVS